MTLLHVAATAPAKISTYLQPLLPGDHHHIQPQDCWETLTQLFALTSRAAQAHADQLDTEAWQSLLTIQNRVLQTTAATIAPNKLGRHRATATAAGQTETVQLQDSLQRHLREQTILYESNITLGSTLDQEKILRLMSRAIAEAMEAGACVISEIDSNLQTVNQLVEYEVRRPGEPDMTWRTLRPSIPISDDPVAKQSLQTNLPTIHKADVNQIQPWQVSSGDGSSAAHWGTVLALPIEIPTGNDGLVEIYDYRPNRNFSADDIQLGQILITQTTLALERARLFNETRQRLNEVSTLYTMAQKIAGNLNLQEVMNAIVTGLRQVIGCRGCCIFLLDPATNLLKIEAADGLKPEWREAAKLQIGEGITGRAVA
ncbi:MAG: hypothetical protein R3264_11305, partial [Anaerolineae bacterium]|nr:hypothetical protein [Anaerolineae bacterium]